MWGPPSARGSPGALAGNSAGGRAARLAQSVVGTERMGTGIREKPAPFSQESISESVEKQGIALGFSSHFCAFIYNIGRGVSACSPSFKRL